MPLSLFFGVFRDKIACILHFLSIFNNSLQAMLKHPVLMRANFVSVHGFFLFMLQLSVLMFQLFVLLLQLSVLLLQLSVLLLQLSVLLLQLSVLILAQNVMII